MRTKTFLSCLAVAAAVLLFPTRTTHAEAQFVANFGTVAPEGTPWSDQLREVKRRVEAESDGRVKIKLFIGGILGGEIEMIRDVRRNSRLQGGGFSTAALAKGANVPLLQLPELPYLFNSVEEADYILDQVLFEPMAAELSKKGFILGIWAENGWRSFATKKTPVRTPADLAKFKMRAQEVDVHTKMYAALGGQAVTLPTSEVLTALQTGIVDGFDNTPLFTQAAGWYEPVDHFALTQHIYQPAAIVWSKKFWDTLPPDLQTIIMGDPKAEAEKGRSAVRALEEELLKQFPDLGVEVVYLTDAERAAFAAKTQSVHTDFATTVPGAGPLLKKVKAELASLR